VLFKTPRQIILDSLPAGMWIFWFAANHPGQLRLLSLCGRWI